MKGFISYCSVNQAILLLLIMIASFPAVVVLSNDYGKFFLQGLGIATVITSIMTIVIFMNKWEQTPRHERRLFSFYTDIFIFYSLLYTYAVVASPSGGFISGLHSVCNNCTTYSKEILLGVYKEIPLLFIDSMYYSIVNMTTLGDGSISPKNIFKFAVVSQVGFTFFITVYGVASHFSYETSKEMKVLVNSLSNSQQEPIREEKIPVRQRFFSALKIILTGKNA
ncbi:MAG: hypothetical protein JXR18_14845 [Neptuniibacter sp.]